LRSIPKGSPSADWTYGRAAESHHAGGSRLPSTVIAMSDVSVPRPTQTHNVDQSNALWLFAFAAAIVAVLPGALIGAGASLLVWRATRLDMVTRWLVGLLGVATVATFRDTVAMGWPWRALAHLADSSLAAALTPAAVLRSIPAEMLAGPLALAAFQLGTLHWRRTIHGQEWARYREMESRRKALDRRWEGAGPIAGPGTPATPGVGGIDLGVNAQSRQPFRISADELALHTFVPGGSGSGKTNTLMLLADGALANGWGVVIVDCKGTGLSGAAHRLAEQRGVPITVVDPKDRKSSGYDPCSGDPAAVANKLVGSFTFGGEGEVYKQVAMEVIPVICRALKGSKTPITLDAIYQALTKGGLSRLSRKPGVPDAVRARLDDLDEPSGVGAAGYAGLQRRLGALMEGAFGDLFGKRPTLNWKRQLQSPHITYLSLSATGVGEDAELFGRVITQDLKQVCDDRMRAIDKGDPVTPVLIIYDEFAALREATQIVDLLLQARGAKAPLVVATQFMPEDPAIRKPLFSAGCLIVHRLEAEDAEAVAAQFGTRTTTELTAQVDYETGTSQKGSVRMVDQYNIHPNEIKELPVGMAAVYARPSNRRALVKVHRVT